MKISPTVEPNSDQLNADDLIAGPLTVTVRDVKAGPSAEQPVEIVLDGHRPYRPCKSMRRVLIACWGDDGHAWPGRSMTLYADPSVRFGGIAVGGIRISHVSDISETRSMMLTTTRSKRAGCTVQPLQRALATYPADKFDGLVGAWAQAAAEGKVTVPQIIAKSSKDGALTSEQIADLEQRIEAIKTKH